MINIYYLIYNIVLNKMTTIVLSLKYYCIKSLSLSNVNIFKYYSINKVEYDNILENRKILHQYNNMTIDKLSKYKWLTTWTRDIDFQYYFYQYRIRYHKIDNKLILLHIKNKGIPIGHEYHNPSWEEPYNMESIFDKGEVRYYKITKITDTKVKIENIKYSRRLDSLIDNKIINMNIKYTLKSPYCHNRNFNYSTYTHSPV